MPAKIQHIAYKLTIGELYRPKKTVYCLLSLGKLFVDSE